MEQISKERVLALIAKNCVVFGYPRKGQICVNGFMYYKATVELAKLVNEINRHKIA